MADAMGLLSRINKVKDRDKLQNFIIGDDL
jgi:hypothetical protein